MNDTAFILTLAAAVGAAVPIALAALGELLAEKSGVLNLGVEGMMLIGAVMAFQIGDSTGSLWLALVGGGLALWALLDRLLLPSMRWYIRSRAARVLAEVGQRLKIQVRPFQQIRRQALIDRLIFDDKVQQAAQTFADERGMPVPRRVLPLRRGAM